jgi:hypothetical protein
LLGFFYTHAQEEADRPSRAYVARAKSLAKAYAVFYAVDGPKLINVVDAPSGRIERTRRRKSPSFRTILGLLSSIGRRSLAIARCEKFYDESFNPQSNRTHLWVHKYCARFKKYPDYVAICRSRKMDIGEAPSFLCERDCASSAFVAGCICCLHVGSRSAKC